MSHAVAIETTEGTCKEHMSHAAPDKCREKAEAENELNRASEAIEHEVNTHCMVHPNAENRGVCLGGGVSVGVEYTPGA